MRIDRRLGAGMVERIDVVNDSMTERIAELAIELGADFADVLEVASDRRQQTGNLSAAAVPDGIEFRYRASRDEWSTERGLRIRCADGDLALAAGEDGNAMAGASISLQPRGSWSATLQVEPLVDGAWEEAAVDNGSDREAWRRQRTELRSTSPTLGRAWALAADDFQALRNRELESGARTSGS